MSMTIGIIGIVVAFILLNYLVYKGLNIVLTSVLVSFIIMLTSGISVQDTWNAAMGGTGTILGILAPIIMFGAVLGVLYTKSGAASSLADLLMKPFIKSESPAKRIIGCLCMFLVLRVIIGLAGIDNMAIMYTLLAIAAGMFAKLNIPRKYLNVLLMVGGTCGTLVPGAPVSALVMVEQYIPGFDNSANLIVRTVFLLVFVAVAVFIMYRMMKKDIVAGQVYEAGPLQIPEEGTQKRPNALVTLIPVVAVYVFYNFVHLAPWLSLIIGVLFAVAFFGPYIPKEDGKSRFTTIINTCNSGVFLVPIGILFSMLPGFVMAQSPAYMALIEKLGMLAIPAAFGMLIISILIVGIASTSSVVLMGTIATATFIPAGLSPQACGLILIFATVVLDSLPNNLGIITQCEIMDCSMKECYPSIFRTTVLLTGALSILMAALTMTGMI